MRPWQILVAMLLPAPAGRALNRRVELVGM
jgi:hypothetical protein